MAGSKQRRKRACREFRSAGEDEAQERIRRRE
jgi:hypothetical protein